MPCFTSRSILSVMLVLCAAIGYAVEPAAAQTPPTRETFSLNGLNVTVYGHRDIIAGELFLLSVELSAQGSGEPLRGAGVILDGRPIGRRDGIVLPPAYGLGIPNSFEWGGASSIFATAGDIVLPLKIVEATGRGGVLALPMRLRPPADADADTLPDQWERDFNLSTESAAGNDGANGDPDGDGVSNRDEFRRRSHPRGFHARYFAEGVSNDFFNTTIHFTPAPLPGGGARMLVRTVDADGWASAYTLAHNINGDGKTTTGLSDTTVTRTPGTSFATIVESDAPFVAERSTKWPTSVTGFPLGYGSHNSEGATSLSTRWLFAEGVTGAFHTYVALVNPSSDTATLTVTYYGVDGVTPVVRHHTVAPDSRATIDVNDDAAGLASTDLSIAIDSSVPVAAERSIYRDVYRNVPGDAGNMPWGAGTSTVGAPAPAVEWFFAEGVSNPVFDTYLLLFNPGTTEAQVEIEVLRADGSPIVLTRSIPPRSRATIHVNSAHAALASSSFGLTVRSTNGAPIVAERTVWWNDPVWGTRWTEGHTSMGATHAATRWFAPGNTLTGAGGNAAVYLLLANPGATPATVRVTLTSPTGGVLSDNVTVVIPAHGRTTLDLPATFPTQPFHGDGRLYPVLVESLGDAPAPIVAERSIYGNTLNAIWELGSNAMLTPLPPVSP